MLIEELEEKSNENLANEDNDIFYNENYFMMIEILANITSDESKSFKSYFDENNVIERLQYCVPILDEVMNGNEEDYYTVYLKFFINLLKSGKIER